MKEVDRQWIEQRNKSAADNRSRFHGLARTRAGTVFFDNGTPKLSKEKLIRQATLFQRRKTK